MRIVVFPLAVTAAITTFSVAVTLASSKRISAPTSFAALNSRVRSYSTWAPRACKAKMCVSRRLRPMTSPPGGGNCNSPMRASMGPARRMEARIRRHSSGSKSAVRKFRAVSCHVFLPNISTLTPKFSSNNRISITSLIWGILCKTTGSFVNRQAARIGKAAFLFPEGVTSPRNGMPPSMMNFSMKYSFYCFLQKYLNFLVLNCLQILEPWFKYLRSTLYLERL